MNKEVLNDLLETAKAAAKEAGTFVVAKQSEPIEVIHKGFRDVVTEVDVASQQIVTRIVLERFPSHAIVGEEDEGDVSAENNPSPITWYIDPIDGTSNYGAGLPLFNISIAAAHDNEMVVGVVYDPLRDEMYSAIRGHGAWLNGEPIRVNNTAKLSNAIVCHDWTRSAEGRQHVMQILSQLLLHARTVRAMGSAALIIAWIAAGKLDMYFNITLKAWDIAAAALILSEAGGHTTSLSGQPFSITDNSSWAVSCNANLQREILAVIADVHG